MKKYQLNEIFYSLQGEGLFAGLPVYFVRFSGCNAQCSFCDTDHTQKMECTANAIAGIVSARGARAGSIVCLTGGEPLLQVDADLVRTLKAFEFMVHVETNGTVAIGEDLANSIDWITVSPKPGTEWVLQQGDELKVVYGQTGAVVEGTIAYLCLGTSESKRFRYRWVQPMDVGEPETNQKIRDAAVHFAVASGCGVSLQLHKLLNVQ